jgi:membrane protease YdiL (CAAX protease family)
MIPTDIDPTRFCRIELLALALMTPLFLVFAPRNMVLYQSMALLFLGYIALSASFTRHQVWGHQPPAAARPWKNSLMMLLPLTLGMAVLFYFLGALQGVAVDYPQALQKLAVYLLWALIQQILFQFYFLGRLLTAMPGLAVKWLIALNGCAYGLVHLPDVRLSLLTVVAGVIWTHVYYRDRKLLPVAASHAILGTSYYAFLQ